MEHKTEKKEEHKVVLHEAKPEHKNVSVHHEEKTIHHILPALPAHPLAIQHKPVHAPEHHLTEHKPEHKLEHKPVHAVHKPVYHLAKHSPAKKKPKKKENTIIKEVTKTKTITKKI